MAHSCRSWWLTGSQQAAETSLLFKGNYKEKEKQSGVCWSQSLSGEGTMFVPLTTAWSRVDCTNNS